jgi:argininosuccinate lyase
MKKNKLWQTSKEDTHPLVEVFTVWDDYLFDQVLLPYDIKASKAHAHMLVKIGILTQQEGKSAINGLDDILQQWENNTFIIQKNQEDCHTAIEQYLTENYGDIGKKIHTWRSRNDQAMVMMRLFMKQKLQETEKLLVKLINAFEKKVLKIGNIPMPWYTHMQKAMPTSVWVWLDSFAASMRDMLPFLKTTIHLIDQNPLGSASGFGIQNFELDRTYTTKQLGFHHVQENPMYCGLSRGYFENIVLQTLSQMMVISGRFSSDMLQFTTQEFNFFSLPDKYTTGSSIMPQKRNYDLFEIMRANVKVYQAYQSEIQNITSSIGSGYQRDLQLTKKPCIQGINLCMITIEVLIDIINELHIHNDQLEKSMTQDLFATHEVYELVKKGNSFRDAYGEVKRGVYLW